MDGISSPFSTRSTRLGFHYFPDTLHYRETDLAQWLPEWAAMGISWLVVKSAVDRAIPEHFIQALLKAGIEPLIDFDLPLSATTGAGELGLLFRAYARWGVRGILLFNRPNAHQSWTQATWARQDLVERFLDRFLPLAGAALDEGLAPILPPLEPGGSYWDTSFLQSTLASLLRRGPAPLLEQLVLSAYAHTNRHDLNWGAGGPGQWPAARPYFAPPGTQDHQGFRIFDWYNAISQAVLNRTVPIVLLGAGAAADPKRSSAQPYTPAEHYQVNLDIARLMRGQAVEGLQPVPANVIASSFWLMAAEPGDAHVAQGWFDPAGSYFPTIQALKDLNNPVQATQGQGTPNPAPSSHPLQHYLLLPTYDWGIADWHLDVIRPFVKKYQPTIGFSLEDAALAREVTVIGNEDAFTESQVERLVLAGCSVRRVIGDGTSIATQLAER